MYQTGAALAFMVLGVAFGAGPQSTELQSLAQDHQALEQRHEAQLELTRSTEGELAKKVQAAQAAFQAELGAIREDQNLRLDLLSGAQDRFALSVNILGIVVTLVFLVGGLGAALSAREYVRRATNQWISEEATKLQARLGELDIKIANTASAADLRSQSIEEGMRQFAELSSQAIVVTQAAATQAADAARAAEDAKTSALAQLARTTETAATAEREVDRVREASAKATHELRRAMDAMEAHGGVANLSPSPGDRETFAQADDEIRTRPETTYRAEDWENRALAAAVNLRWEDAALYFGRAATAYEAGDTNISDLNDAERSRRVARCLLRRGVSLGRSGRHEEGLQTAIDLVAAYRDSSQIAMKQIVAWAEVNRTWALGELGRFSESFSAASEFLQLYETLGESEFGEQIGRAHNTCGFTKLIFAKQAWPDEANMNRPLKEAIYHFDRALALDPEKGMVMGNIAYANFLLGNADAAQTHLTEAFRIGGARIRKFEIDDSKICEIPPDAEFRKLIDAAWIAVSPELFPP